MLTFKYSVGALQGISAIFMLWAIVKFSLATGRSLTLSELSNQKMIVLHFMTMLVYLASVLTFYIYYA